MHRPGTNCAFLHLKEESKAGSGNMFQALLQLLLRIISKIVIKWANAFTQVPNLICWHCLARLGDAVCVNCPQKHTKRAKSLKEPLPPTRALLSPAGISGVRAGSPLVILPAAGHGDYDGVSSEGRVEPAAEGHSVDESNLSVGVRLGLPLHASPVSDLQFVGSGAQKQHQSHHQSQHHHHQQPAPPSSFFSEKAGGPPVFQPCNSGSKCL